MDPEDMLPPNMLGLGDGEAVSVEQETEIKIEFEPEGETEPAMTDDELAALLDQQERTAVGYLNSEVADEQELALNYYYGRPFGDEQQGRSQVVDRTVAVVVDNALASLLRPFVSSDEAVSYSPRKPEDEEAAKQATEYVNYVFHYDNQGFAILHDWFKDALLSKLGIVKAWWEDEEKESIHELKVDAMELQALQAAGEQIIEIEQDQDEAYAGLYEVKVRRSYQDGCIKIENVPPEEFRISPYSRDLKSAPYLGHVTTMTRSSLIEMGFDPEVIEGLSKFDLDPYDDTRKIARYEDEDEGAAMLRASDKSQELVQISHEFPLVDYDGDGKSERREVIRCGKTILYNEEVEDHPFSVLCPVPMPHKVYGMSLADQVLDLQRIRSVLWRQMLDNLYLSNNPRPVVPAGAERPDGSTIDDLLDNAPGAVIRVEQPSLSNFAVPFVADKSFPMLDLAEKQITARTGVSLVGQGLNPDTLKRNKTATEIAVEDNNRNARVEMIARIFAETGVKDLFRKLLRLVVKHQPRERVIRLRNQWVAIDPRAWNADMDVQISVGLGVGNRQERASNAMQAIGLLERLGATPFGFMVEPKNVYQAVKELLNALGYKNIDNWVTEPNEQKMAQQAQKGQQPSPEMMKLQGQQQAEAAKFQLEQQKAQAEMQMRQAENVAKLQTMREEAALKAQLERERAEREYDIAIKKMQAEMALAERKMQMEVELAQQQMAAKAAMEEVKMPAFRPGGELSE